MTELKNLYFKIGLVFFGLFFGINQINSQDLHYSQFYNSPLNVNPANAGIFNGDLRFNLSVRDQWRSVPIPWFTMSAAVDKKFLGKNSEKGFFSMGMNYNYDRQGSSNINLNNLNLAGSYSRIINKNNVITGGLLVGYSLRGFNRTNLTWDKQWDGDRPDFTINSGEDFDMERVGFVETGAGLNYRWQRSSRTNVDVGIAGFHLVEPVTSFYEADNVKLPMRLSLNAVANVKLIDELDVQLHILSQQQGAYEELVYGGLAKIYLNQKRGKELQFHLGASYRTTKFLVPTAAVQFSNLYLGLSYDIDMTEFSQRHDNRGGPEVHLRYIITNVKPLKHFKICPIF